MICAIFVARFPQPSWREKRGEAQGSVHRSVQPFANGVALAIAWFVWTPIVLLMQNTVGQLSLTNRAGACSQNGCQLRARVEGIIGSNTVPGMSEIFGRKNRRGSLASYIFDCISPASPVSEGHERGP